VGGAARLLFCFRTTAFFSIGAASPNHSHWSEVVTAIGKPIRSWVPALRTA